MSAVSGSYGLSGIDVAFRTGRRLPAAQVSYVLTGLSASLKISEKLAAGAGSYILTGQDIRLVVAKKLTASPAAYVLSGSAVLSTGEVLETTAGVYVLNGVDANIFYTSAASRDLLIVESLINSALSTTSTIDIDTELGSPIYTTLSRASAVSSTLTISSTIKPTLEV
jgi:hypothetical protein